MIPIAILIFLVAVLDWLAVAKGWKKIEYFAKPATMLLLLAFLLGWMALTGPRSLPLYCFAMGVFFSLVGDVFLLVSYARLSNPWFFLGLAAFLLAHVSYILGLNIPLPDVSPFWALVIALVLALTAARLLRRIVSALYQKGLKRMVAPVTAYAMVITVMLLSAILTLYNPNWGTLAAGLVAMGAVMFYLSDVILAWNRYVTHIRRGRLANMVLYHLGQFALVAGVVLQFGL